MPGLLRGVARTAVVAGTASTVAGRVQHRQQQRWAAQGESAYGGQQQTYAAPPPPPAAAASTVDQLKELADLKNQGILTDEEFAAQKAKILNS